ncbi:glyoxalase/bleomycin resistance/extradiol dioxygenase family protein [Kitasatospora purpeofusca]|uniref:VOC family protein n=1 Tax=Kitasatospora purpeofusca TaxID=67352 RepID=UPI0022506772|nr:VOC family protein [Kitasatospora purpeofusca]MCX4683506.1 glyoxalase/bleomycin resistance/extradiol dioxygenase family protein [Kitasatospora purpeofusca]
MDALYHRLLVADFPACFGFYQAVLTPLTGAALVKGTPDGPYATWDLDGQAVLSLFDRGLLAATVGTAALPAEPAATTQDGTMLVFRVEDVGQAFDLCLRHGAAPVVDPTDRPDWGPGLRTAHLRDPEGRLIELQSY